jgi:hypothetical protein
LAERIQLLLVLLLFIPFLILILILILPLRDRWQEQIDSGKYLPQACAKYDLRRSIGNGAAIAQDAVKLLAA